MFSMRNIGIFAAFIMVFAGTIFATNGSEERNGRREQNQCTQNWLTNNISRYGEVINSYGVFNAQIESLKAQLQTCQQRQCSEVRRKIRNLERELNQAIDWAKTYEQCSNRFTILEKPVITGPTSVMVGENKLYSVIAKSSNITLPYYISYTIDWGDGSPKSGQKSIVNGYPYESYHAYDKAGTYTITTTVKDSAGKMAKNSLVVEVSEKPSLPKVAFTFPNGGENIVKGSNVTVVWNKTENLSDMPYELSVFSEDTQQEYAISALISDNVTSFVWPLIGLNSSGSGPIPVGKYKLRINYYNKDGRIIATDISDHAFNIIEEDMIKLLFPNDLSNDPRKNWIVGQDYTITWESTGLPASRNIQIGIIDTRYSTEVGDRAEQIIAYSIPNTGSFTWTVPRKIGTMDLTVTQDSVYKILIHSWADSELGYAVYDISDHPFGISDSNPLTISVSVNSAVTYKVATDGSIEIPFSWASTAPNRFPYAYLLNASQDNSNPAGGAFASIHLVNQSGSTHGSGGVFLNQWRPIVSGSYKIVICDQSTSILVPTCGASDEFLIESANTSQGRNF